MSETSLTLVGAGSGSLDYALSHLDALDALGQRLAASGMLPKDLRTPAAALAVILTGHELGMGPMEAARSLHYVEGRVVMAADAQLARALRAGVGIEWVETSATRAAISFTRPGSKPYLAEYTWDDAQKAGLAGRKTWQAHPRAMLRARAITSGIRAYCPDVLGAGVYSPDEAEDIVVTSRPAPQEAPRPAPVAVEAEVVEPTPPTATADEFVAALQTIEVHAPDLDRFRAARGKPPLASLTAEQRAQAFAAYLPGQPPRRAFDAWLAENPAERQPGEEG